jgi:hypothetical protein
MASDIFNLLTEEEKLQELQVAKRYMANRMFSLTAQLNITKSFDPDTWVAGPFEQNSAVSHIERDLEEIIAVYKDINLLIAELQ